MAGPFLDISLSRHSGYDVASWIPCVPIFWPTWNIESSESEGIVLPLPAFQRYCRRRERHALPSFRRTSYSQPLAVLLDGAPVMRKMLQRILTQVCILGEGSMVSTVSSRQQWYVAAIHNLVGISVGVVHTDIDLKDCHDHHGFR